MKKNRRLCLIYIYEGLIFLSLIVSYKICVKKEEYINEKTQKEQNQKRKCLQ